MILFIAQEQYVTHILIRHKKIILMINIKDLDPLIRSVSRVTAALANVS
jgi:hypothetical protein